MSEKIKIAGQEFEVGQKIRYKSNKGDALNCTVTAKFDDPSVLQINCKLKTGREVKFAVAENQINSRITKIAPTQPNTQPQPRNEPRYEPQQPRYEPRKEYATQPISDSYSRPKTGGALDKLNNLLSYKKLNLQVNGIMLEFLMVIALAAHALDWRWLRFSGSPEVIGSRIAIYGVVVIASALVVSQGRLRVFLPALAKFFKWAAIPVIGIPAIVFLAEQVGASADTMRHIAGLAFMVPIYALLIRNDSDFEYSIPGDNFREKFFNAFTRPSGWVWLLTIFLTALLSIYAIVALAGYAQTGAATTGIDAEIDPLVAVQGAWELILTPITSFWNLIQGVGPAITGNYTQLYNETLGAYYLGQVEENKEITGVFIREFRTLGTYFEDNPVSLVATIQLRSFVEEVNLTTHCYARELRNETNIIPGTTNPPEINNLFRNDFITVSCDFDQLSAGRYEVTFVTDFNFETWAYKTLTLMERGFLSSLYADGVNVQREFNIAPRTRTIYTNGPVSLGMNDAMEMPIALTTDRETSIPLGLTIDERTLSGMSRGNIRNVQEFQIRAPQEFEITRENCVIPGGGGLHPRPDDLVEGYTIYTFDVTTRPGVYTTVSCNAKISPQNAMILLNDPSGKQEVTIAGSVTYNYTLQRRENLHVQTWS